MWYMYKYEDILLTLETKDLLSIVLCENLYANLYMNHLLCNLSFQEQQNKEKKCWQTCSDDHVGIHPFFTPHGWDNPTSLRAVCWFKVVRDNEFLKGTKTGLIIH